MKNNKKFLLVSVLILIVCILAGCGAKINTELNITKDFSGQRKINVVISNDDLSENVKGGIKALKSVADSKLPKGMTVSTSKKDGNSILNFVISFKNIEDYRSKVSAVIEAGSNKELVPEIEYENLNTVFKKGVKFKENFTSFDLLQWYFDALQKADIITEESTSNWYEIGDSGVVIDKVEYDSGSQLSVNKQEICCLDNIEVKTTMNIDGTFVREFKFSAYDTTVEELSEKGCNLSSYISKLASEEDTYTEDTDGNLNKYIITVNADDTEQLTEKTDKILQTKNKFAVTIEADKENVGNADIQIEEKLDGSFYLNYDNQNPLLSKIELYDNCSLKESNKISVSVGDDLFSYYPSSASDYKFDLDWKISFASVEIVSKIKNKNNATIDFVFTSEKALEEDLKKAAVESLKKCCGKNCDFKENGDVATISFSGTVDELNKKIDDFIKFNDSQSTDGESYFNITFDQSQTVNKFTNAFTGNISYDLSPIIGNTRILFNDVNGFFSDYYYQGDFLVDENGDKTVSSNGEISFTLVKLSLPIFIIFAISVILIFAGLLLLVVKRKEIIAVIAEAKSRKKEIDKSVENVVADGMQNSQENPEKEYAAATTEKNENSESEETEELL